MAHAQLVLVLDGGGSRLNTAGGEVSINTSGLEQNLASRLGLSPTTSIAGGKIVIFTSDQLSLVQTLAHWLKVLAWVLPFVSLALYALAVYLATGYRRRAVRNCGIGIIVAGVILVIATLRSEATCWSTTSSSCRTTGRRPAPPGTSSPACSRTPPAR